MANSDETRLSFTIDLARRAGELALTYFRDIDSLTIESKGHQDLVSNGDKEVELFVRRALADNYPDDGVVGEEHAPTIGISGYTWIIDPIDGTANFVRGIPAWAVVIACMKDGETVIGVIYEPSTGEMFSARRGGGALLNGRAIKVSASQSLADGSVGVSFNGSTRASNVVPLVASIIAQGGIFFRNASGALMLAYVAAGRLIGYSEERMNAWDCVAAMLIIEEAGGLVEPFNRGDPIVNGTVVVVGAPGVFGKIRELSASAFETFA